MITPMKRSVFILLLLLASLGTVLAQAPPPVPALPDAERRTQYNINSSTCACSIGFQIYQDSTDIDQFVQVFLNGTRYLSNDPVNGWTITSNTGSLGTIPRPITDGVLTFNNAQTATVQIVGAQRPRRLTEVAENRGVAARDFNQFANGATAQLREQWDKQARQFTGPPGTVYGQLPAPTSCIGAFVAFDATGANPICVSGTGTAVVTGSPLLTGPIPVTGTNNSSFTCGGITNRSNSGSVMIDTLPTSVPAAGCVFYIRNNDASAFYGIAASGTPQLDGVTGGYFLLGPGQTAAIQSSGTTYTTLFKPVRAKLATGVSLTLYYSGGTCSNSNMPLSQSTPWCDPQQCWNYAQANLDIGNNKGGAGITCQQLDSTVTASNSQGGGTQALSAQGNIPGQGSVIGITIQGNCTTPANTVLHPSAGSVVVADDYAQVAISCLTVQIGTANANVFTSQHGAFIVINDKVTVNGGAQTGPILVAQNGGAIITFGTLTIANGNNPSQPAFTATVHSRIEMANSTVTWTTPNNPVAISTYTVSDSSVISASGMTYNGSPTVTNKYTLSNGGFLNTGSACSGVPGTGTSVDGLSNCH